MERIRHVLIAATATGRQPDGGRTGVDTAPTCSDGVRTRVAVREGAVVVRYRTVEERVAVGEQWPRGCVASGPKAASPGTVVPPNAMGAQAGGSSLAAQNYLFAAAAEANRLGDSEGALAALERFLATYPTSPLRESATVERMRILQTKGLPFAQIAAKDYLARYATGFARDEAKAILDTPQ